MKVEIWSDHVCPFCYIGKRKFEKALSEFAERDQVEVAYRSFEIDPHAPLDVKEDIYDALAKKYGMTRERTIDMANGVEQQAKEVGLDYDFDRVKRINTRDAHRLTHFATTQGKMAELTERLLKAYFIEFQHIGDHETLAKIAAEVGLDHDEVLAVLSSNDYNESVQNDINEASKLGVNGVPFFVIDQKYAVSGAQSSDTFKEVLEKVWAEKSASPLIQVGANREKDENDPECSDGSCKV
ncbi:DsbA family oxidoreductase [Jeotgalibacillus marinus]|uniref:DsbA family oxidoreductase n=1 Tax=Jeotgalibacillus marinus TaxID=86667 RepID=A0ABV3Q4N2_9BACL